jgi:ABC-type lipopolysaccharide export system ATPase subunit
VTRALAISERAHLLRDGEIVLSGEAGAMLEDPEVQRICLGI